MIPDSYVIKPGDTLSAIGRKFGVNYQDIAKLNGISNPNLIYSGHTLKLPGGQPTPVAAPAPVQQASTTTANTYGMPTPTARPDFSTVLPFNTVFNPNLIQQMAEQQVMPDINRAETQAMGGLNRNLAQTGGFRIGTGAAQQQDLADQYTRQGNEGVLNFGNSIKNLANDWYNQQYKTYSENPSAYVMPKVPTLDSFMQSNPGLASAYQAGTSGPTQFTNPLQF